MITFLVVCAVVVVVIARRRSRTAKLSGTVSTAPVFSVEPPARRHSRLKGEAL